MGNKRSSVSLRRRYMEVLLPLLVILFLISLSVVMGSTLISMKNQSREIRQLLRNVITVNLDVLQDINFVYDSLYGEIISEKLYEFSREFDASGEDPDKMDLKQLQHKWGSEWDLYIINSDEVITHTTYFPDKGLDFNDVSEAFARRLKKIRISGEPVLDKITHESFGRLYRKYGYQASASGEFLLEVGVTIPMESPMFNPVNPAYLGSLYETLNQEQLTLEVFQLSQLQEKPELQKTRQDMLNQHESYREEYLWKPGYLMAYLIYQEREKRAYPSREEYFLVFQYPLEVYKKQLWRRIIIGTLQILLIMAIGVLLVLKIIKSLTKPIELMVQDISTIARGNWSHPITSSKTREILKIKQSVEHLVLALLNEKAIVETSERQYRLALEASRDAIFEWFPQEHYLYFSGNCKEVLGADPGDLRGKKLEQWFYNLFTPGCRKEWKILARQVLSGNMRHVSLEMEMQSGSDEEKWIFLRGAAEEEDGQNRIIGILADISLSKKRQKTIENLAYTNQISGRRNLLEFYRRSLTIPSRKAFCAFTIINLDDFTRINTTFGHVVGEGIIKEYCRKIEEVVQEVQGEDSWALYHINQDNLLVVLEGFSQNRSAKKRVTQLFDRLCQGIYLALEREFYFTVSIGAVIANCRIQKDKQDLIRRADMALLQAKSQGKNTLVFYKNEFSSGFNETYEMIHHIWEDLQNHSLRMVYQPIVDSRGVDPVGFEALLRTGKDNTMSPAAYVKASEDSGLIHPLGTWIIEESFRQAKVLTDLSLPFRYISVNISPLQFRELDFARRMQKMCFRSGILPEKIQIEITETALMESADRMIRTITLLKEMGFRIALDDFGTGYSSLDYLAHLPIDAIKIEKKMTSEVQHDLKVRRVVTLILQIARELSLEVIAEGVEDWEHVRWMVDHGCSHHQGYYYSKPVNSESLANYLAGK